jgi:hypothetical protein
MEKWTLTENIGLTIIILISVGGMVFSGCATYMKLVDIGINPILSAIAGILVTYTSARCVSK